MKQHYLDPDGRATASGNHGESQFEKQMNKRSIKFSRAMPHEQQRHWDYFISNKKVEVKADKRISRDDYYTASKSGLICLELSGAQCYNNGWLAGEADLIAFGLFNDDYIFFNRSELYNWAKEKASSDKVLSVKPPVEYQQYYRWSNKNESIIWAKLDEMKADLKYTILKVIK